MKKILLILYNITSYGIQEAFRECGFQVDTWKPKKEGLSNEEMSRDFKCEVQKGYDFVFGFDFEPMFSDVCQECGVLYVSWTVDGVLYGLAKDSVFHPVNRIFCFDRVQYEALVLRGVEHVYHLPLAADSSYFECILREKKFSNKVSDVTFVGHLYDGERNMFRQIQYLPEYLKGYLEGLIRAQQKVWGYSLFWDSIPDALWNEIKEYVKMPITEEWVYRQQVIHFINTEIAFRERTNMCERMSEHFDFTLYSGSQHTFQGNVKRGGYLHYENEMPHVFHKSKINMNVTLRSIESGIPLRVLDVMACGGFVLTNYQPELAEYFEDGKEIAMYGSEEEMLDKAAFYLKNETERKIIARAGYEKTKEEFCYRKRVETILDVLGETKTDRREIRKDQGNEMRGTTAIIIAHNEKNLVQICIQSLREHSDLENFSVVVVDNASEDGLHEWAAEQEDFVYIYMNEGYTACGDILNQVIVELQIEEDILLLSPSIELDTEGMHAMKMLLYQHDKIGAVGPRWDADRVLGKTMQLDASAIMFRYDFLKEIKGFDSHLNLEKNVTMDCGLRLIQKGYELYVCENVFKREFEKVNDSLEQLRRIKQDSEHLVNKWGMKYFNVKENADLLSFLPEDNLQNVKVLEIGCDCGANLLGIKKRLVNAELYGAEINPRAVSIANGIAEVIVSNIEEKDLPYPKGEFDYIVFGDVLEHLREPEEALRYCGEFLKKDGKILASIPNVMHISVVEGLMKGDFTYTENGILDKTHIHMFTFNEIASMFGRVGLQFERIGTGEIPMSEEQKNLIGKLQEIEPNTPTYMYTTYQYVLLCQKK